MNTIKNLTILLLAAFLLNACASYQAQYLNKEDQNNTFPDKEVDKVFYLVGDAGFSPMNGMSQGLIAFQKYISDKDTKGDYTLFLGDNIYPAGLPQIEHKYRGTAENMLNAQINAVENFEGQTIFIPGNHEWYSGGLTGVRLQEEYIKEALDDNSFFPEDGCPLKSIDVSETIQLIIVDTQWYLVNWDRHPTINEGCQIKTRERLMLELEGEIKKAQGKTIVFAMHHPMYTNSTHGGQFALEKHLFPMQRKIPMPGLASLVTQIRSQGGVSIQDRYNELYNNLMDRLENLATENGNIVFVSGHEHTLQYIDNGNIKQIVSGSGSKTGQVNLKAHGVFAYGLQGFAVMTVFKDGSSWVQAFGSENNTPHLLFQKEIYPPKKPYDYSILPDTFPNEVEVSIYSDEETDKSSVYKMLLGDRYRNIYSKPIKAPVATLDTLYGGLEVVRAGGGHQTKSLRLKTKDGRELNMRALRKSPTQYLEKVLFKNTYVADAYEQTEIESLILDFYTAAHPYAFMAIPDLSDAAKIYHTNPQIFYIPKHKHLGEYNSSYGGQLYMIEERPEENYTDERNFGYADDIESTYDIIEKVRKDEKYKIDENAYIRARLFDMLIGDWDRHQDQWRWAQFNQENGDKLYKPIPRDRDQVFSNFDGTLLDIVRVISGSSRQLQVYDEELKDIKWMNSAGVKLDRVILQQSSKEAWLKQAKFLEEHVTDEIIDKAFSKVPVEVQDSIIEDIKVKLKGRRSNMQDIASRYYNYLNELVVLTGTDKDDYFEIIRLGKDSTRVKVSRLKDGGISEPFLEQIFDGNITKELWIYGLNDDDQFEVTGKGDNMIFTRIVGGQGNDVYNIKEGKRIKVYDHKSKENTVLANNGAAIKFTDVYKLNLFDFEKNRTKGTAITPNFSYNPDDGVLLGGSAAYTVNGFQRNPFSQQHSFNAKYAFATSGFKLDYHGEFANFFYDWNLSVGGTYTNESYTNNFFGYGNESVYDADHYDYNRVRTSIYSGHIEILKRSPFGSDYGFRAIFEGIQLDASSDRFITTFRPASDEEFYERHYFSALEAEYDYLSADNLMNPTKGMTFHLDVGARTNLQDADEVYAYINSDVGFYNALTKDKTLVLKTDVRTQFRFGNNFLFYQAANIGGDNGLRGYRAERFTGKNSMVASADLRYSFPSIKTRLLPLQITIFGGGDVGRVWFKGDYSDKWHNDYGGGLRITAAKSLSGTFNLFTGEDGSRFSFGFGFNF
ncbi:calcineurin-like phosphoesterase family protein [Gelidibacter sediminis]|uniref:Calcineurin-like phosphoesterase family protein n=1 Tax=Gelidibacter sediminis TaxID=1608710 RepID=A0A4R7Q8D0_9FLAO|nr:metallophosphoesterase [Gelidibacter sediminis]TDU42990.1 calcineurin-like phosphoesterase family protein [Gelidibacter sediminis]